jgi:hypothetical protein
LHEPTGIILRKGADFGKDVDAKKRRTDWQALSQVERHHLLVANAPAFKNPVDYASATHRADLRVSATFGGVEINPIGGCK